MENETLIRVRYCETDQMGIVHHSRYYPWFEIGRTEYLRTLGHSYKEVENMGVMLPLTETHCKYKIPVIYDDEIIVKTSVKKITVARIAFSYILIRQKDKKTLAEGETVHGFTDCNGKPINLKKKNPDIYEKLVNSSNQVTGKLKEKVGNNPDMWEGTAKSRFK